MLIVYIISVIINIILTIVIIRIQHNKGLNFDLKDLMTALGYIPIPLLLPICAIAFFGDNIVLIKGNKK